ncbi:MAG: sulfur carrier protein ThiS [Deltaproteobacteria bacterium]|nr:sulfur carrier protein ThiS [Deltaproteobacteria bacterium]
MRDIILNGEKRRVAARTVSELLEELSLSSRFMVIEINKAAVSRSEYSSTNLSDGDRIEIVSPIGGG